MKKSLSDIKEVKTLEDMDRKTDRKIRKFFGPIITILFSIIIADRMTWFLTPEPKDQECGTVITSDSTTEQYQWDKSHGKVQMLLGDKTYSVNNYVEAGDTVCKSGDGWIKKDDYLKKFLFK